MRFPFPILNFLLSTLPISSALASVLRSGHGCDGSVFQPSDRALLRRKLGVVCAQCEPKHFGPFADVASWFYDYKLSIESKQVVSWMNANGIEYVPMIAHANGISLRHWGGWCDFDGDGDGSVRVRCTVDMLIAELKYTQSQMTVKPVYLMGWNEPYMRGSKKGKAHTKYIDPAGSAVAWWRHFVQPVAEATKLKLVAPSAKQRQTAWLGDFLMSCWDHRRSNPPCSLDVIHAFAVHDYECSESYWNKSYGGFAEKNSFQSLLAEHIGDHGRPHSHWKDYIDSRKIWVTETNCNWDDAGRRDVSPEDACDLLTGNGHQKFGQGSVRTMLGMDAIERFAWWNTFNPNLQGRSKTAAASLVDSEGQLTAPGRALVSGLHARIANCSGH